MQLSTTLKTLMQQKSISNYRLSVILDVSPSSVANWLNGTNSPTLENLIDMSNFFDVSIDYLIKGKEFVSPVAVGEVETTFRPVSNTHAALFEKANNLSVENAQLLLELANKLH